MSMSLKKSTYNIPGMDCPSEEGMIRIKLDVYEEVLHLEFDLEGRSLVVFHTGDSDRITDTLDGLGFGSNLQLTQEARFDELPHTRNTDRKLLLYVLAINFAFFVIEAITGYLAQSLGLLADSLDMFADSIVYGLSLLAVSAGIRARKMTAGVGGIFQSVLAVYGFYEVISRFLNPGEIPGFAMMIGVSTLALGANTASLLILRKSKSEGEHIQASMIFTSNDVIANLGVILAGVLVYFLKSPVPDLVVGSVVFALVMRGAYRILQLAR